MEERFTDFYEAWNYLRLHKEFNTNYEASVRTDFLARLDIYVVKVNPKTKEIDDNKELNTETNVWLELGVVKYDENLKVWVGTHDMRLDCGATTFEEAIIKLANLFAKFYEDNK